MNTFIEVPVGLYKLVFIREHDGNRKYLDNLPYLFIMHEMAPGTDKRVPRDIYFPSCLICAWASTTNSCKYLEL